MKLLYNNLRKSFSCVEQAVVSLHLLEMFRATQKTVPSRKITVSVVA